MAYIERDILINNELIPLVKTLDFSHKSRKKGVLLAISKLKEAPSADVVEVKHGHWGKLKAGYWCSNCCLVEKDLKQEYNYCPNCGAKMDGKD